MGWIEAIVLGVVQGLTEFLPISSTAHLRVVPAFLGWEDPGAAFTAVTQLGTMAAVLLFFRQELWAIAVAWLRGLTDAEHRRTRDSLLGWYILVGTIPIGVFGLLFADQTAGRGRPVGRRRCRRRPHPGVDAGTGQPGGLDARVVRPATGMVPARL